jgi:predicted nuclease of restriction endonuclease-like (RecB) superfamily
MKKSTNLITKNTEITATLPAGYDELLHDIKARVQTAQMRATVAVNTGLVLLYWQIGSDISKRMQEHGWGAKVVDQLAIDLRRELPDMTGFSLRNLRYMRSFAEAWPQESILQQLVAKLPWGHNVRLLDYLKTREERLWYARATIEYGWSRNVLVHQIESRIYERQGKATTNFERTLPLPQSDLARQLLKDPYNFEFLTLQQDAEERELEKGLIAHIQKFLLELGSGFAFVGRQYHLEIGGEDFYIDLLFYHLKLRSYIVIELKSGRFKPEYAGKINFYLAVVDDLLRHPDDAPSIGLVLCKEKSQVVAEYSLRNMASPIGVSEYQITEALPDVLKRSLPTVEQLEAELAGIEED